MCSEPMDVGYIPVMIAERDGAHTGAEEKAFVYRAP
jgi:hypothetical protein